MKQRKFRPIILPFKICRLRMSGFGTFETCRRHRTMSGSKAEDIYSF
jgi:hypothetical protein